MAYTPISERANLRKRTPSSAKEASNLISLIENRAREVGIACINMKSFEITLTQYVDNTNYLHTLSVLYSWDPIEIVMCKSAEESPLRCRISSHLSGFDITFLSRKCFDEVKGEDLCLNSLSTKHFKDFEKKYVSMAALSALIYQIEASQSISIYKESLKINFIYLKNFVIIDFASAKTLELVVSSTGNKKASVAGLFDCKSPAGNRMLRATLLQPNRETLIISQKLDAVQELVNNSVARIELKNCVANFSNTELSTSRIIQKPKQISEKFMKAQINNLISLYHNLTQAQVLLGHLIRFDFKAGLLQNICNLLDDRRIDGLVSEISQIVSETVLANTSKKVQGSDCLHLIKEEINTILDISRQVLANSIEEIHKLENQYKYKLSDPSLSVINTATRGYHLQIDSNVLHRNYSTALGEHLLQITHKGKKCFATTLSLLSLNEKIKASQTEIISITYSLIESLCEKAREKILCLYNLSHAVASLDVLISFANFSINFECVRPKIQAGLISLENARNPLMLNSKNVVANSVKFQHNSFLHVLTGVNASGKTTLLKNTAIQCILAHSGCFLPVTEASVSPLDYLLTRIGEKESIEQNISSFMGEMKDCGYILNTSTESSLVLIDELGKSTSSEDAVAISWAICERLMKIKCFTVISTHFHLLATLKNFYEGVVNIHIENFQVKSGSCNQEFGYGIEIAAKSALPREIVENAKSYCDVITKLYGKNCMQENNSFKWAIKQIIEKIEEGVSKEELTKKILLIKSEFVNNHY